MKYVALLVLVGFLHGCGGSSGGNGGTVQNKADNVSGALKLMEGDGAIPKLDRSDTLKGLDADANGIRDDIDQYVNQVSLPEKEKDSLRVYAKGMQKVQAAETMTPEVAQAITDSYATAYFCLLITSDKSEVAEKAGDEIAAYTANTPSRAQRFVEYNEAMGGRTISIPDLGACFGGQ